MHTLMTTLALTLPALAGDLGPTDDPIDHDVGTYYMSQYSADYDLPSIYNGAWGYHALQWKAYTSGAVGYTGPAAGLSTVPGHNPSQVNCTHDDDLDDWEAGVHGTIFNNNGGAFDPGGTWGCTEFKDAETTAALAVIAMWAWQSPVYLDFYMNSATSVAGYTYAGVIQSITVDNGTAQPLETLCGFTRGDVAALKTQAAACAANHNITVTSVDMYVWDMWNWSPANTGFQVTLSGPDFAAAYAQTSGIETQIAHVLDPDEEDRVRWEEYLEVAKALSPAMFVETEDGDLVPLSEVAPAEKGGEGGDEEKESAASEKPGR